MKNRLFKLILAAHYGFRNNVVRLIKRICFRTPHSGMASVLIVRKGTLGDIITALPAMHLIQAAFPNAKLGLLTTDYGREAIGAQHIIHERMHITIHQVHTWSITQLAEIVKRYDAVIELPQYVDTVYTQCRNMFFFRLMGIRFGAGWIPGSSLFLRKLQLRHIQFQQETERLFAELKRDGIEGDFIYNYPIREQLVQLPPKDYVVIAPGAKHARKRWPMNRFVELAGRCKQYGLDIIWLGDETDAERLKAAGIEDAYCGKLNVAQSFHVMRHARGAVTNDSGPMHLAYAAGIPLLALFSARDYPGKWYPPRGSKAFIFQDTSVACAICIHKPCDNNICMAKHSTDTVWNQLLEIIT